MSAGSTRRHKPDLARLSEMSAYVLRMRGCQRILDVGASLFTLWLSRNLEPRAELTCLDAIKPEWPPETPVKWVQCDLAAETLPWEDAHFDLIVFGEVLEHLTVYPSQPLRELCRVLRPGGHLLVTTPNAARLSSRANLLLGRSPVQHLCAREHRFMSHYREYTMRECLALLGEAGLIVKQARYSACYDTLKFRWMTRSQSPASLVRRLLDLPLVACYCFLVRLHAPWRANLHILAARPPLVGDA